MMRLDLIFLFVAAVSSSLLYKDEYGNIVRYEGRNDELRVIQRDRNLYSRYLDGYESNPQNQMGRQDYERVRDNRPVPRQHDNRPVPTQYDFETFHREHIRPRDPARRFAYQKARKEIQNDIDLLPKSKKNLIPKETPKETGSKDEKQKLAPSDTPKEAGKKEENSSPADAPKIEKVQEKKAVKYESLFDDEDLLDHSKKEDTKSDTKDTLLKPIAYRKKDEKVVEVVETKQDQPKHSKMDEELIAAQKRTIDEMRSFINRRRYEDFLRKKMQKDQKMFDMHQARRDSVLPGRQDFRPRAQEGGTRNKLTQDFQKPLSGDTRYRSFVFRQDYQRQPQQQLLPPPGDTQQRSLFRQDYNPQYRYPNKQLIRDEPRVERNYVL